MYIAYQVLEMGVGVIVEMGYRMCDTLQQIISI